MCCLFSVAGDAEQIQEQVDEIKIQGQGTDNGNFLSGICGTGVVGFGNAADLLCVIGGEACENQNARIGNQKLQHGIVKEEIHHGRKNQTEKAHQTEIAHA